MCVYTYTWLVLEDLRIIYNISKTSIQKGLGAKLDVGSAMGFILPTLHWTMAYVLSLLLESNCSDSLNDAKKL